MLTVPMQETSAHGSLMPTTRPLWQSLPFKPNYKAACCLALCPAGEDVIEPYLYDRKAFITVYVLASSPANAHAQKRFPRNHVKVVGGGEKGRS